MVLLMTLMAVGVFLVWLWKRPQHPVDQLPGPKKLPLIGNAHLFMCSREELFRRFNAIAIQYAPLYRTWLGTTPVIHLLDPKYVEIVLRSTEHIAKSRDYDLLKDWLGTGLLTSGGSKWHARRKALTPAFHFSILEQCIPIFNEKSRILVKKLRENCQQQDGVNIIPFITKCTLDIICEAAMGAQLNAQDDSDSEYATAICEINELFIYRLVRPWLYPKWIFGLTPSGRRNKRALAISHAFTDKVIKERRAELMESRNKEKLIKAEVIQTEPQITGIKNRVAFLDLLLQLSEQDPELNDEEIRQEVDTFMFEGHDTTAMAISWALHYISCNPDVQDLCYAEVRRVLGNREATLSDLNNMRYLERVIKETLRLRPSVYLISRQIESTLAIEDYEFPAGTKVQIHIHNIHHDPKLYPDPETFDPERFLPENTVRRHPYAYIPFSAGPRNCIGQKFGMLEMKSTLSTLVNNFRLECRHPDLNSQVSPDILLRPKNGIVINFIPRYQTVINQD